MEKRYFEVLVSAIVRSGRNSFTVVDIACLSGLLNCGLAIAGLPVCRITTIGDSSPLVQAIAAGRLARSGEDLVAGSWPVAESGLDAWADDAVRLLNSFVGDKLRFACNRSVGLVVAMLATAKERYCDSDKLTDWRWGMALTYSDAWDIKCDRIAQLLDEIYSFVRDTSGVLADDYLTVNGPPAVEFTADEDLTPRLRSSIFG